MNNKQKGGIRRKENNKCQEKCPFCSNIANSDVCTLNCGCCMHLTCFVNYLKRALLNKDDYFTEDGLKCINIPLHTLENGTIDPKSIFKIDELGELLELLNTEYVKELIKSNTNLNLNLKTNNKYNSFKNGLRAKFVTVMQKNSNIIPPPVPIGLNNTVNPNIPIVTNTRCIKTLTGHSKGVMSVAFSPDGRRIVSGSDDNSVRVWDTDANSASYGACVATLKGHSLWVTSVSFSPDGRRIVSGSGDESVRLWDADANSASYGACVATLCGHPSAVNSVSFSPDGTRIACSSRASVWVWDVDPNSASYKKCVATLTDTWYNKRVHSVVYSPNGKNILMGNHPNDKLLVWDVESKGCVSTLTVSELGGYSVGGTVVAYNHDGTRIVAGSDYKIKIWQQEKKTFSIRESHSIKWKSIKQWRIPTKINSFISSICYNHNGTFIVAGFKSKNCLQVFDANSGDCVATLYGNLPSKIVNPNSKLIDIKSVSFSPDGTRIASGSEDKTIKIWDVSDLLPQAGGKKNAIKKKIKKIKKENLKKSK